MMARRNPLCRLPSDCGGRVCCSPSPGCVCLCVCVRPPGRGQGSLPGSPPAVCRRGGYLLGRERGTRCSPMRAGPRQRSGAALRGWPRARRSAGWGEVRPFLQPQPQPALRPARPTPPRGARGPAGPGLRRAVHSPGFEGGGGGVGGHGQSQPGERERPRRCSRQLIAGKGEAPQLGAR